MNSKKEKLENSYLFLLRKSENRLPFTDIELSIASGWKISTTKGYLSKKLREFTAKEGNQYVVISEKFPPSIDVYISIMSQVYEYSRDPYRPYLNEPVERLVNKAREAAILAVDIYNRPMTTFRSQGYIVMMIIAWTSLLHAIFENEGIEYIYRNKNGELDKIDGDYKTWELSQCLKMQSYIDNATKANLNFFIPLRNKIEHRYSPEIDLDICGECQSLLLNFEDLLTQKFGSFFSVNTSLSIPLQLISSLSPEQIQAKRKLQGQHYQELKEYIDYHRQNTPDEILSDIKYCFRVYLVPKTSNRLSSADFSMEFVKVENIQSEQYTNMQKAITIIKEKHVQVANQGLFKPKDVSIKVSEAIGKKFHWSYHHSRASKYYKVRQDDPAKCDTKYCQYDVANKDYLYTQAWIDFLISELSQPNKYYEIYPVCLTKPAEKEDVVLAE